jgi:5-methyltetrahydrofolate--homocysteine methyltransferase
MKATLASLAAERVVVLDGAMGTALMDRGLEMGECTERWNEERPDAVRDIHRQYVSAGADVIQTNTFGANVLALARHNLADQADSINRAAVAVAREAAGDEALVAGNIGPSGRLREPLGDVSESELEDGFARQAATLVEAGVDYLSVETMSDLGEALCALRAVKRVTDLPVAVCMTFDRRPKGWFTMMGDSPGACVRRLADDGAAAVGANCSTGSRQMVELCPELVAEADVPVIVKPNAGLPELVAGKTTYRQVPDAFARDIARMVSCGARAVGGCCGTDAQWIEAIVRVLGAEDGQ